MYCTPTRIQMRIAAFTVCFLCHSAQGSQPPSDSAESKADPPKQGETAKHEELTGVVVKVVDGDSIKIRQEGEGGIIHEVQIEGMDAPEFKQAYGPESTEALRKMVMDRNVRITWEKKDNFGRQLAQVYLGETHINKVMIREGNAWHFKRYNQSKELAELEEEARKAKRGLWATDNPQAPWDYRKENRSPDKPDR